MDRVFASGASGSPPAVPASPSIGYATAGNAGTATPATKPGPYWFHMTTEEIRNVIVAAGLTPDVSDLSQLSQAIQILVASAVAQDYKASARVATTANITTLAGGAPNALDGVTLVAADRVLVKDQSTGSQNGIYVVTTLGTGANGTWTRATDADGVGELTSGAVIAIEEGTLNADTVWMLVTNGTISIGSTPLLFTKPGAGSQQAGEICMFAMNTAPSGFLKCNGAAISRSTYAALFAAIYKSSTVTMTIASPGVITWTGHPLVANDPVQFTSTGVLPTGFATATTYFVVGASITTNTFQLSATAGGAAINTSGSQSGTHTAHNAPYGIGDGSTTFNVPELRGEFLRGWDDGRGVDANRAFGRSQTDSLASHSHTYQVGGYVAGDPAFQFVSGGNTNVANSGSSTGSTGGAETRPRNVALLACIKF